MSNMTTALYDANHIEKTMPWEGVVYVRQVEYNGSPKPFVSQVVLKICCFTTLANIARQNSNTANVSPNLSVT